MAEGIKKMKPRNVEEPRNKIGFAALVAIICIALAVGIAFAVNGSKSPGGKIIAQTTAPGTSSPSTPASSGTSSMPAVATAPGGIDEFMVPPLSIYRRRNPFRPLVKTPYQPTTVPTGTGAAGVVSVPPALATGDQAASTVVSTQVTLDGVFEQGGKACARVSVADKVFDKLSVGDVFGDSYKLLDINKDGSAVILYGDERFTVYVGQSIYW